MPPSFPSPVASVASASRGPSAPERGWPRGLAVAAVLAVATGYSALSWRRERNVVEHLSTLERKALYERTSFSLRTICRQAADALPELCFHQARLIVLFPECDDDCERLANRLLSRAGLSR